MKKRKKKKGLLFLGGFLGIAIAGYAGVAVYFNSHYLMNTKIGAIDCGGKTVQYVIDKNKAKISGYLLSVTDRQNGIFPISGADIAYEYTPDNEEERILAEQNSFLWPMSFFNEYVYDLDKSVTFDEGKLDTAISKLKLFDDDYITKPADAYLKIEENSYEVVPEVEGNSPIFEQIKDEITAALDGQIEEITLSDACYEKPQILSTDPTIDDTKKQLDAYTGSTIHYLIDGVDENLSSEDILKMLVIGDDNSVTLDESKITGFVQHLASTYNTYGDVREFKTSSDDIVKIGGGDYGWVINKTAEAEQIKKDLQGGVAVEREPVYEQTAIQSGLDDIGNTYIEIDYGKQHLWYYKDGKLVEETDIVSGNLSNHNGSVDGIYSISYKERNATLNGEGYSRPVNYFMPFAYNIGIHDAGWRHGNFGGTIYKHSGSHGCINIPPEMAQKLFEIVETGTPVVAYYREKVELTNTAAQISNAYSYVKKDE